MKLKTLIISLALAGAYATALPTQADRLIGYQGTGADGLMKVKRGRDDDRYDDDHRGRYEDRYRRDDDDDRYRRRHDDRDDDDRYRGRYDDRDDDDRYRERYEDRRGRYDDDRDRRGGRYFGRGMDDRRYPPGLEQRMMNRSDQPNFKEQKARELQQRREDAMRNGGWPANNE